MVYRTSAQITENLKDAGCTDEVIQACLADWEQGKTADGMKLLSRHRAHLLDDIHQSQKKIDCLDYLLYQMKSQI